MKKNKPVKYGWINKPISNSYAIIVLVIVVVIVSIMMMISLREVDSKVLGTSLGVNTYYVNQISGNLTNPGTEVAPFKTIQQAVSVAVAGDTILVAPGNYTGTAVTSKVVIAKSGSSGAPITIKATAPGVMTNGFYLNGAGYVIIDGFDITTPINSTWNSEQYGSGVYLINAKNCEVRNNNIHNTVFPGVFVQSGSANNIIYGNKIDHAGTYSGILLGQGTTNILVEKNDIGYVEWNPLAKVNFSSTDNDADGIKFEGSGHIIRGNYIHDLRSPGTGTGEQSFRPHTDIFQTWHDAKDILIENNIAIIANNDGVVQGLQMENPGGISNITFRNNVFSGLFRGINIWGSSGRKIDGIYVYNNTFYNIQDYGTEIHYASAGEIKNNIYYNVFSSKQTGTCVGASLNTENSTLSISNNIYYKSSGNIANTTCNAGSGSTASGDFKNLNPLLTNVSANNFRLQPNSPSIDKGIIISSFVKDIEGTSRPQGSGYDLGAYEYITTSNLGFTTTTPTTTVPVTTTIVTSSSPIPVTTTIPTTTTEDFTTSTNSTTTIEMGTGLLGQYFNNKDLTNLKITRVDPTVNFNWRKSAPTGMGIDTFSVRWTGKIYVKQSGLHSLYLKSDDGSRLWIDGKLVIDRWINQRATEYRTNLTLTTGFHDIKIEYFENNGNASAVLSWSGPGISKRIIPKINLYPANQ